MLREFVAPVFYDLKNSTREGGKNERTQDDEDDGNRNNDKHRDDNEKRMPQFRVIKFPNYETPSQN
jgi:hypothetical protein